MQRRTLAPLFTPKTVNCFGHPATAAEHVARWERMREGRFDVRPNGPRDPRCPRAHIFSDGLGQDWIIPPRRRYFASVGRLDIFDLLDFPDWVPRWGKIGNRSEENFFASVVETIIAKRKRCSPPTRRRPLAIF